MDEKTLARFWLKVDKNGPVPRHRLDLGKCWVWTAGHDRYGYGRFCLRTKVTRLAHRIAWEIKEGPPRDGIDVLHKCDNPPCVNPGHLFLGTMADNMADKITKGRQAKGDRAGARTKPESYPRGEAHWKALLTDEAVASIRSRYLGRHAGPTQDDLAAEFGVSRATVNDVLRGRCRVRGALLTDQRFKLSEEDVVEIRNLYRGRGRGPTQAEIAARFGVTQAMISAIVLKSSRKPNEPPGTHDKRSERSDRRAASGIARADDPVSA